MAAVSVKRSIAHDQMYHDLDTFDFSQGQESTNGNPSLVE